MSIDPQPLGSESKKERESFWSIDKKDRLDFSLWFSLVFLLGFGLLCWYHICHENKGCTFVMLQIKLDFCVALISYKLGCPKGGVHAEEA